MIFPIQDPESKWRNGPAEPARKSPLVPLLIGCGVLTLLGLMTLAAGIVWIVRMPEGGVRMANQMDVSALNYLARHKILNRTERVVAYYDVTISMSGEESATVTTERVIYHKDGRTTAIPLKDVVDVRNTVDAIGGDNIEVIGKGGDRMKIEIPPLNDGKMFLDALNETRLQAKGEPGPPTAEP